MNEPTEKREIFKIAGSVLLLLAGVGVFFTLRSLRAPPAPRANDSAPSRPATVAAEAYRGGIVIEVDGTVVPFREVAISAEVSGRVTKKSKVCRAGNFVAQGTELLSIDPQDYDLVIDRLTKELAQADVSIEENKLEIASAEALIRLAQEDLLLQRRELQRILNLARTKIVTESDTDQARRGELASRNTLQTLASQYRIAHKRQQRIEQAKELVLSNLKKAELDRSRADVTAPFDGVIVTDSVERDSYVQKGTPLVTIEDTSSVEVKCHLRMDELFWLWHPSGKSDSANKGAVGPQLSDIEMLSNEYQIPKTPATVIFQMAGREYHWKGRLSRFDGIGLDQRTRTVPCRVLVENPRSAEVFVRQGVKSVDRESPALVRGMFVTIRLDAKPQIALVRIPKSALRPGNLVFVLQGKTKQPRSVRVADLQDEWAILDAEASGLKVGDEVVAGPTPMAKREASP